MLISKEELIRRLGSEKNLVRQLEELPENSLQIVQPVKRERAENAPTDVKVMAGVLVNSGVRPRDVRREFGLTAAQTSDARNSKNPDVQSRVSAGVDRVQEIALARLMESLGLLDADTISSEKPKDIAAIAASMSKIYSNLSPKQSSQTNVQLVVYAPRQRTEKDFEVVDL